MSAPRPPASRRAERAAARASGRSPTPTAAPSRSGRSPVLVLTIGVLVIAGVLLAGVAVMSGAGSTRATSIASPRVQLADGLADGRVLGRADAPVTLDLWADFQCPVCLRFTDTIEPLLRAGYVQTGAVRVVFHDLAFIGQESIEAAAAARIADAIGPGFWPMHDLLYGNQGAENGGAFSDDRLAAMAVRLGMDRTAFLAALADPAYTDAVKAETAQGTALGVSSTPTLVINGTMYPGLPTWDQLSALLDDALAAAAPSSSPGAS
jgi:protein-disulfide isomerase